MKHIIFCIALITITINTHSYSINTASKVPFNSIGVSSDSLPAVLPQYHADLIESKLRLEAILKFGEHRLPNNLKEWENYRLQLKKQIIEKTGLIINHKLPVDMKETGSLQMEGYSIKNIFFQTRPGIYATANLYIPEGKGPFPGVITMHGHWPDGRLYESFQAISESLALNGFVCLNIDAWGAGERTTISGKDEYHGGNLGASLLNIGESLIGVQISDNMRGVDLLCSLPYVDPENIGATGASGGGNQTMWLAAIDDRIKAAVPVVSVGTFESCVMRSNCICELLTDGLSFTEEAGILALIAPRAIKICNNIVDNPTFISSEMLRSFNNARPVFKLLNVQNSISNVVLNKTHGYWPENRETMLGWFDLYLKGIGTGAPKKEIPFQTLPKEQLLVFPKGQRDARILSTDEYCRRKGNELRTVFLNTKTFDAAIKRKELSDILRINEKSDLKKVHKYSNVGAWNRLTLETSDNKLIPVLQLPPINKSLGYVIVCNPEGKKNISLALIDEIRKRGSGIAIVDLSGTGEATSTLSSSYDRTAKLHTLSRAELWLGKTVLGEWGKELKVVSEFLKLNYKAEKITIDGSKEAGLAALFMNAVEPEGKVNNIILRDAPVSYLFDDRESVDFFSMAIHLPGFLNWGDVSLATALSGKNVTFINPLTMSGRKLSESKLQEYKAEDKKLRTGYKSPGSSTFKQY